MTFLSLEGVGDLPVFLCRFVALVGMVVWVGGFMFYGGVVVPILDEALGSHDAGMLTRRVTNSLNAIGMVVVLWSFLLAWLERRTGTRRTRATRIALLIATALSLAALAILHIIMDNHLDRYGLRGFRIWHRRYLMVSTGQWIVNLGLLAVYLQVWSKSDERRPKLPAQI
jgi:Domain of unknown function (DUF4149)